MKLLNSLLLLFFLVWPLSVAAQGNIADVANPSPVIATATQQLSIDQSRNTLLAAKLATLQQNKQTILTAPIDITQLHRADLAINFAQADLTGIKLTLNNAQQALKLTQSTIDTLQNTLQSATADQQTALRNQLNEQYALSKLQQARVKALAYTQTLAQQTLEVAQDWKIQLQTKYQLQQQQIHQQTLNQLANNLQEEQQEWLTRLTELNRQLAAFGAYGLINSPNYATLEMNAFEAEERSNLSQIQLDLARLHNNLENLTLIPQQNLNLTALNNVADQTNTLIEQLKNIQISLQNKNNLLQKRIQITLQGMQNGTISASVGKNNLSLLYGLLNRYQQQLNDVTLLQKQALAYQTGINQALKQHISSRQGLPGFDWLAWKSLGIKLLSIPMLTWQHLNQLQKPIEVAISASSTWQWLLWGFAILVWGFIWRQLHRLLANTSQRLLKKQQNLPTTNLLFVFFQLLKRFLAGFMLIGGFIGLLLLLNVELQTFSLVIGFAVIVLIFALVINLARTILLENTTETSGHDIHLFYRLQWTFGIGGLITLLTFLVHQIPIAYAVQDLFDRLFMLFLLIVGLVLLRGWNIVPAALSMYLENKPRYLKQAVRWLSLLVPLTILSNALLGLIGYVELAWSIAAYQGLFLIVLAGFLLARGIVGETVAFISGQMIRRLKNGWLWSEAFLKPLHQILKIILFLGAFAVLFWLYGWGWNSWIITNLLNMLNERLFVFAGSTITPLVLFKLILVLAILNWATRWSREFAYRWLFARTKDLGLRNSLAIFTQYTLVIIGILIGLNVIGINLTALTYVASAFAFGVGLGLRDLANNFVCGILLLIERPVRVGDYVTLGGYNGEVIHIGMRSVTVRTDDHQELLVPNAEVFNQSFVNWTHRDNIIRVAIPLKINRIDDPHRIKTLVLDVIKTIPKILTNPPATVYLKDIDDVLLHFELEYYLDIHAVTSRGTVRSQLLLALLDRFKSEGIHAPDVMHEINIINPKSI